jgi:hypothetical protein
MSRMGIAWEQFLQESECAAIARPVEVILRSSNDLYALCKEMARG